MALRSHLRRQPSDKNDTMSYHTNLISTGITQHWHIRLYRSCIIRCQTHIWNFYTKWRGDTGWRFSVRNCRSFYTDEDWRLETVNLKWRNGYFRSLSQSEYYCKKKVLWFFFPLPTNYNLDWHVVGSNERAIKSYL